MNDVLWAYLSFNQDIIAICVSAMALSYCVIV